MGLWTNRVKLAAEGWNTDLRIEVRHTGACRIGLWAKSWFWCGRIAEVSIHAHDEIQANDAGSDIPDRLDRLSFRVREAIDRAVLEVGDAVPCVTGVLPDGRIRLGAHAPWMRGAESDPTVEPPVQAIRFSTDGPETGAYRAALARILTDRDLDWQDALNSYAEPRLIGDPTPREWQFVCQPKLRRIGEMRVHATHYRHTEFTTRLIGESIAAGLMDLSVASLRGLLAEHAPGGVRHGHGADGLPPGFSRVALAATPPDASSPVAEGDAPEP